MYLGVGEVIAEKYRILRLLGEGGMGAVYEGENVRIRHRVAIKVLHAAVAGNKEVIDRFEREAEVAGQAGSEHIVEVLDLGALPNGQRFMVMEFLDGESLAMRVDAHGPMTIAELIPAALQLLDGLAAAHDAGIVHRDLKPENVYLLRSRGGTRDFVKILDFGISKFNLAADNRVNVTRTGSVMGTPCYMSPEHARGARDVDFRTDLYGVGVMLYECLSGVRPFDGENPNEVLFKVVLEDPPKLAELVPGLDPRLIAIVDKGMARNRDQRFQTAREFQEALLEFATAAGVSILPRAVSMTDTRVSLLGINPLRGSQPSITPARPSRPSNQSLITATPSPAAPGGRVSVGSVNPVVVTTPGRRVPKPLLMVGVGLGITAALLGGVLLVASASSPDSERAAARLQKVTTWEPPLLTAHPKFTVTPADAASSTGETPKKKPKRRLVINGKPVPVPLPAPVQKNPANASGRKIYTEL
jgi:eukaryotic-like serine/threonine-protein kinase